jgi:hypothetical protein
MHLPDRPVKPRPSTLDIPHEWKVKLVQLHRHYIRALKLLRTFLYDEDPWAVLTLLGIRNFTPIRHKPNVNRPLGWSMGQCGYVVGHCGRATPPKVAHAPDPGTTEQDAIDYELGKKVTEADAKRVQDGPEIPPGFWKDP